MLQGVRSSRFAGKRALCFGISFGINRQTFLKSAVQDGLDLTILRFPGECLSIDHQFSFVDVTAGRLEEDIVQSCISERLFDGAVTYEEFHVERMSKVASTLRLRKELPPLEIALRTRDKALMKRAFEDSGVPIVEWSTWTTLTDLKEFLHRNDLSGGDFVLKPRLGTTSAGVYRSRPEESPEHSVTSFFEMCRSAAEEGEYRVLLEPPFIVERFISRYGLPVELAIDGYVHNGVAHPTLISEKVDMVSSGPFIENKYVSPPISDFILRDRRGIEESAHAALLASGIDDVVFHLEMRYDNSDIRVLEIASRPGGGLISESSCIRFGLDLRRQHLLLALGLPPDEPRESPSATCFGTVYFEHDFKLVNLQRAAEFLRESGMYHELSSHPEARRYIIHDGLIAFGVTDTDSKAAYRSFYKNQELLKSIMRA